MLLSTNIAMFTVSPAVLQAPEHLGNGTYGLHVHLLIEMVHREMRHPGHEKYYQQQSPLIGNLKKNPAIHKSVACSLSEKWLGAGCRQRFT